MAFFSISCKRPGRTGEPKTAFDTDELAPTPGEAIEIRVDRTAYLCHSDFWAELLRLETRMRETAEPRPVAASPTGQPWSDGTFWSDGTGWLAA